MSERQAPPADKNAEQNRRLGDALAPPADLREQVKDVIRGFVMNDLTPLPSDVGKAADAVLAVVRERLADDIASRSRGNGLVGDAALVRLSEILAVVRGVGEAKP